MTLAIKACYPEAFSLSELKRRHEILNLQAIAVPKMVSLQSAVSISRVHFMSEPLASIQHRAVGLLGLAAFQSGGQLCYFEQARCFSPVFLNSVYIRDSALMEHALHPIKQTRRWCDFNGIDQHVEAGRHHAMISSLLRNFSIIERPLLSVCLFLKVLSSSLQAALLVSAVHSQRKHFHVATVLSQLQESQRLQKTSHKKVRLS